MNKGIEVHTLRTISNSMDCNYNKSNPIYKKVIWVMAFLYYTFSFVISYISGYGKYLLIGSLAIMLFAYYAGHKGVIKYRRNGFIVYLFIWTAYVMISSLWSFHFIQSINIGINIAEIAAAMIIIYICFEEDESTERLLKVIMWGGYAVVIYSILYYGPSYFITKLSQGIRISSNGINSNALGMCAAMSISINIFYILNKNIKWWSILGGISFFVLAASGSRKAIVILIIDTGLIAFFYDLGTKKSINSIIKKILIFIAVIALIVGISRLSVMSIINERLNGLIAALIGRSGADTSALTRLKMISLGREIFKQSPVRGIGFGSAQYIVEINLGLNTYLHNNFVEILAGGGIIGFIIYYSLFAYLIYGMIKYRDFTDKQYIISFTLLIASLVTDCGQVSYESKDTYVNFLLFYLTLRNIKSKRLRERSLKNGIAK